MSNLAFLFLPLAFSSFPAVLPFVSPSSQVNLTLNQGSSYSKIREAIIAFDTATTKWNESGALTFSGMSPMTSSTDPNGPVPMEIDRIKGDGKKGKGKTKDSKGKSKGKDDRFK